MSIWWKEEAGSLELECIFSYASDLHAPLNDKRDA